MVTASVNVSLNSSGAMVFSDSGIILRLPDIIAISDRA